MAKMEKY